jgi:chemotaxis signal transduction protein
VIDLRVKFGLQCRGDGLIVTVEGASDVIGAVVDDVVAVLSLAPGELSRDLALQTRVPAEFFLGVAKLGERLVNVIDIAKAIDAEDYAAIRRMA